MRFKALLFFAILAIALASLAQTATPTAPPNATQDAKTCACCNHDKADGSSKTGGCKDDKCPMMSGSHSGMKCPMMAKNQKKADGKMCGASNQCPMHAKGGNAGCCCGNLDEKQHTGM